MLFIEKIVTNTFECCSYSDKITGCEGFAACGYYSLCVAEGFPDSVTASKLLWGGEGFYFPAEGACAKHCGVALLKLRYEHAHFATVD